MLLFSLSPNSFLFFLFLFLFNFNFFFFVLTALIVSTLFGNLISQFHWTIRLCNTLGGAMRREREGEGASKGGTVLFFPLVLLLLNLYKVWQDCQKPKIKKKKRSRKQNNNNNNKKYCYYYYYRKKEGGKKGNDLLVHNSFVVNQTNPIPSSTTILLLYYIHVLCIHSSIPIRSL